MELALNLAWICLAVCMVWQWLRIGPRAAMGPRTQLVALALVIAILLPAISMTDDLQAAQKPAEFDICSCLRRTHDGLAGHTIVPGAIALVVPLFAGLFFGAPRHFTAGKLPMPFFREPEFSSISSRPPPAA